MISQEIKYYPGILILIKEEKMKKIPGIMLILLMSFISGCITYHGQNYGVSADNISSLNKLQSNTKTKIKSVEFTSYSPGRSRMGCRAAGPISTPNGEPFDQYIKEAFIDELKIANLYDPNKGIEVKGHLKKIATGSGIGNARWVIHVDYSSPGKETFSVNIEHKTRSSWLADKACLELAHGLGPAVQKLLKETFSNPEFIKWLQ